jgi:hypothetical protein
MPRTARASDLQSELRLERRAGFRGDHHLVAVGTERQAQSGRLSAHTARGADRDRGKGKRRSGGDSGSGVGAGRRPTVGAAGQRDGVGRGDQNRLQRAGRVVRHSDAHLIHAAGHAVLSGHVRIHIGDVAIRLVIENDGIAGRGQTALSRAENGGRRHKEAHQSVRLQRSSSHTTAHTQKPSDNS